MHEKLKNYLDQLSQEKEGYCFPKFCSQHSKTVENKYILAIHQDLGNSGPEKTGECSIYNPDPTAKNLRDVLEQANVDFDNVLFWNFYPFFGYEQKKRELPKEGIEFWAEQINRLVNLLPNVRVLVVSGNDAWLGMRFCRLDKNIQLIHSPHPSQRGMNASPTARKRILSAWTHAIKIIGEPCSSKIKSDDYLKRSSKRRGE